MRNYIFVRDRCVRVSVLTNIYITLCDGYVIIPLATWPWFARSYWPIRIRLCDGHVMVNSRTVGRW